MTNLNMSGASFTEVWPLIRDHHYLHRRTGDPIHCFAWREPGGLLGDTGAPLAAIIYTAPANRYFGKGSIELSRLVRHPDADLPPLTQFVSWSLRWLKANTDFRYCLSYADKGAGHHGGIYQAANFVHVAVSSGNRQYRNETTGEIVSGRSFDQRRPEYKIGWKPVRTSEKYLYIYPLREKRKALFERFAWSALPNPKPDRPPA